MHFAIIQVLFAVYKAEAKKKKLASLYHTREISSFELNKFSEGFVLLQVQSTGKGS